MSYTSSFYALLDAQRDEDLSLGCFVLMSASNFEHLASDVVLLAAEPMAHVLAWQQDMILRHVRRVFAQDPGPVCTPSAENAAVADLPVPAVAGPGVCIPTVCARCDGSGLVDSGPVGSESTGIYQSWGPCPDCGADGSRGLAAVSNGIPLRSHCDRQLRPSRVSCLAASSIPFRTAALATKYRVRNWAKFHMRLSKKVLMASSLMSAESPYCIRRVPSLMLQL